jgi:aldose sugar dehydrogenase
MLFNASQRSGSSRMGWRSTLALIVVASAMFVFGFTFQKYKYFPFSQLRNLSRNIAGQPNPLEVLSQQYSRDTEKVPLDRNIDTGLLPLKIRGIRLSDHFSVPKTGGALTTIGDVVVVLDRLGNIYSCTEGGEHLEQLSLPKLPNNIGEYLKTPDALVNGKRFRAYDIKFLKLSKMLAVSHEYFDVQLGKARLAVSVISIDDTSIRSAGTWETIFLGDPEPNGPNEDGAGKMVEAAQDKIYLSVGDYIITSPKVSQDKASSFGKIIEIDLKKKSSRMVSLGHRNPEGLVRTKSGALLSTEHGPKGGDELNLITEGANYGWPNVSLGTGYASYDLEGQANVGDHSGYTPPIFSWLPSIAVSNLIEIEGFDGRWNGDLLVASLKALSLFRLRFDGTKVVYSEPIWIGQRIRDLAQLSSGTILLWTDDTQLLFVSVDRDRLRRNVRPAQQVSEVLNSSCMYCHHFGATTESDPAPTLTGLFSKKIASDNFRYSTGLRNLSGSWSGETLKTFLSSPASVANGTSMPNLNLDRETINEIVRVLEDIERANHADLP